MRNKTNHVGTSADVTPKSTTAPKCCGCQNMRRHLREIPGLVFTVSDPDFT